MKPINTRNKAFTGLILCLTIPSTSVLHKYLGVVGVAAYIISASFVVLFLSKPFVKIFLFNLIRGKSWLFILLTFIFLLAIFLLMYPISNSGILGGGSDRDEALSIATTALLHGDYPYLQKTYLGNPITPLPGALILAAPFVLCGNIGYQNLFWLFSFFLTATFYFGDRLRALHFLWIVIALSPAVIIELVTGGDYLSNSIYVAVFSILMIQTVSSSHCSPITKFLSSFLLGLGLASRANFLLILPLLVSTLLKKVGFGYSQKYVVVTCVSFLLLTVPFYLYAPNSFTTLHTINKLSHLQSVIPHAEYVISVASLILAIVLSFINIKGDLSSFLLNSGLVILFPAFLSTVLQSIRVGKLDLYNIGFALPLVFFSALVFGGNLCQIDVGVQIKHQKHSFF